MPSSAGRTRPASGGITSRPANRSRTASLKASTSRLRDELLNETLFRSLPHARAALDAWRHDYNEERPHSKLGWMMPRGYASALIGEIGRDAALRWGSAPRPLATHGTEGSNQPRTLADAPLTFEAPLYPTGFAGFSLLDIPLLSPSSVFDKLSTFAGPPLEDGESS